MDNRNPYDSVVNQHTFMNHTGNVMIPSSAAYEATQSDGAALRTFCPDYECRPDGFVHDAAATSHSGWDFQGLYSSSQYFCQPIGHFSNAVPPALGNTNNDRDFYQTHNQQYRSAFQTSPCVPFSSPRQWVEDHEQSYGARVTAENDAAMQRKRDFRWVRCFSRNTEKPSHVPRKRKNSKSDFKPVLYTVAQLVTQLDAVCNTLRTNVSDGDLWTVSYNQALHIKKELEDKCALIDCGDFKAWKRKLHRNAERRTRKQRHDAEKRRLEHISEKEAVIDAWRLRHIRGVEEKKKERELKLVADAILCEVRKKQADVKRMQDILRSLQRLHKLRKEAALRKGIVIERKCEEAFSCRLDQLNSVLKVRTSVYATEEKALKVMIEGEHEEEKRRDQEKQMKKKKEKLLLKKCMLDAVLFGEFTSDAAPQPFIDYYNQAECSVGSLLQIRSEWDMFVVAADHPDGSSIPQNWIMPDQPSDEAWASSLHLADSE
ncbi:programmed cell death protein 7 isoform X2 [Takifugu rubripes]|uniref:programmed cell death protein 7 isoform X2 n=1 Tax=Takifugu rubripes TaxID=31033 RepID=UPI0011459002|nr:programmed cell death protein 7 isoform X2 [Takifugu rubripes]